MSLPFFEAMVDAAVTETDGVAWGRILTLGLKEFGKPDTQLKDVNQLQPAIQLLGALTTPFKLQRCLVSAQDESCCSHTPPVTSCFNLGSPLILPLATCLGCLSCQVSRGGAASRYRGLPTLWPIQLSVVGLCPHNCADDRHHEQPAFV